VKRWSCSVSPSLSPGSAGGASLPFRTRGEFSAAIRTRSFVAARTRAPGCETTCVPPNFASAPRAGFTCGPRAAARQGAAGRRFDASLCNNGRQSGAPRGDDGRPDLALPRQAQSLTRCEGLTIPASRFSPAHRNYPAALRSACVDSRSAAPARQGMSDGSRPAARFGFAGLRRARPDSPAGECADAARPNRSERGPNRAPLPSPMTARSRHDPSRDGTWGIWGWLVGRG
jgi:hypothetical protein